MLETFWFVSWFEFLIWKHFFSFFHIYEISALPFCFYLIICRSYESVNCPVSASELCWVFTRLMQHVAGKWNAFDKGVNAFLLILKRLRVFLTCGNGLLCDGYQSNRSGRVRDIKAILHNVRYSGDKINKKKKNFSHYTFQCFERLNFQVFAAGEKIVYWTIHRHHS